MGEEELSRMVLWTRVCVFCWKTVPFSQTGDTGRGRVAEGESREPEEELVESRGGRKAAEWRTRRGSGLEVERQRLFLPTGSLRREPAGWGRGGREQELRMPETLHLVLCGLTSSWDFG